MDIGSTFRRNLVLFAVVGTVVSVCAGRGLAASIRGWGISVVDSKELGRKDFIAISVGAYHSLALKADGSIVAWGAGGDQDRQSGRILGRQRRLREMTLSPSAQGECVVLPWSAFAGTWLRVT